MTCKTKWIITFFSTILFSLYACQYKHPSITDYVKKIRGQELKLGENQKIDTLQTSKILILVPDTGDCTTCAMQVYDWYIYKLDLEKHNLNCEIIYILNDSVKLNKDITSLLKHYGLHQIRNLSSFYSNNVFLKNIPFTTFLIDKANQIKLVGSPIDNEKLWELYKETLSQ